MVGILGPTEGDHADREGGMGRMLEPAEIFREVAAGSAPRRFPKKKVLIKAGPTYEPIDTVRGVTNQSSGKNGLRRRAGGAGSRCGGDIGYPCHRARRSGGRVSAWT